MGSYLITNHINNMGRPKGSKNKVIKTKEIKISVPLVVLGIAIAILLIIIKAFI